MKINLRMEIFAILVTSDEGIEQIVEILECELDDLVNRALILAEVERLVVEKFIYIAYHDEEEDYNWYAMTPEGWAVWEDFDWDAYFEATKLIRKDL